MDSKTLPHGEPGANANQGEVDASGIDNLHFGDSPTLTDDQHDLYDCMSEISEEGWCAGWISDNEYTIWDAITLGQPESQLRAINPRLLRRCKKLSEEIGGWIRWTPDGPEFVPMAQWLVMVATWRSHGAVVPE